MMNDREVCSKTIWDQFVVTSDEDGAWLVMPDSEGGTCYEFAPDQLETLADALKTAMWDQRLNYGR